MPGDKITAKVYAKYVDTGAPDVQQALFTFLTALGADGTSDPLIDGVGPGCLDQLYQNNKRYYNSMDRNTFLKKIQSNIHVHGYHVTSVAGTILPRFVYTIGCKDLFGSDLVFCGAEGCSTDDITRIISEMVATLKKGVDWRAVSLQVTGLGSFTLSEVDSSWSKLITLGIYDFYNTDQALVLQILPDQDHWTLDIPTMSEQFNTESETVWQWLVKEWDYPIPSKSSVVTNLKVLYGEKATEVMRWEEDEWEIFTEAASDIPKDEMRAIPLAVLLGIDKSLEPAVHLQPGKGLWRDADDLIWNDWG